MDVLKSQALKVDFSPCSSEYELQESIGKGAYGVVCSAVHKQTKAKVAIKKISKISDHIEVARRTLRELKILRYFKHENIISIRKLMQHTKDDKNVEVYIVLDYMDTDLHNLIQSNQVLSIEHIRYFLYQMLCGLKYIHSANVLHRDLKPSNILVNENCLLKIGDFGLARGIINNELVTNNTNTDFLMTQYVATRWYRAPELLLGTNYTFSVDLWSVGCILAEMFRKTQLFPGKSFTDQLFRVLSITGLPPDSLLNYAPEPIQNFVGSHYKNLPKKSLETEIPVIDPLAFDLLQKLLKSDPTKRPTADDALNHSFLFKNYKNDVPPCHPPFDFSFDKQDSTKEDIVNLILSEVKSYELKFHFTPNSSNCFKKPSLPKKAEETTNTTSQTTQSTSASINDIHMQSAGVDKKEEDLSSLTSASNIDSRTALKQAILRKQKQKENVSNDNESQQKPMTAYRKMKERQMKRENRKNKNKKKIKDKQKEEKNGNHLLSDDDKKLLERWNAMQQTNDQVPRFNVGGSIPSSSPPSQTNENFQPDIEEIPIAEGSDKISEITINMPTDSKPIIEDQLSALTRQLNVDDFNLLDTPKGTGDGYGIGLDLDELLTICLDDGEKKEQDYLSKIKSIGPDELNEILDNNYK